MTTEKTSAERGKATVWRLVAQLLNGGLPNLIDELYSPELASRAPRMDRAVSGALLARFAGAGSTGLIYLPKGGKTSAAANANGASETARRQSAAGQFRSRRSRRRGGAYRICRLPDREDTLS